MKVSNNKFVSICYDLYTVEDDTRDLIEKATAEQPFNFIYGASMMLESFEKNIYGLGIGDRFSFILKPEEAYGEYDEERLFELPKTVFEKDGKFDDEHVVEGHTLPLVDSEGNHYKGLVLDILADKVLIDINHDLAGEHLLYEGEILDVHEPTAEEIVAITADFEQWNEQGCNCGGCDCGSCEK